MAIRHKTIKVGRFQHKVDGRVEDIWRDKKYPGYGPKWFFYESGRPIGVIFEQWERLDQ